MECPFHCRVKKEPESIFQTQKYMAVHAITTDGLVWREKRKQIRLFEIKNLKILKRLFKGISKSALILIVNVSQTASWSGSDRKPEVLKISQDLASVIYGMSVMTWCFPLFETKLDLAAILVQTVMQKSTRVLSFQSFCTNQLHSKTVIL